MASVDPNFRISGPLCPPLTPFTPDGELNLSAMPPYVSYLDTHFDGAFILGTMGEGLSLTVAERKQIAEHWVQTIQHTSRLKTVIVHVGTGNLKDTVELAGHAGKVGATAIACMAPNFYKPPNEEVLVKYMKQVAAAAPNTPFYYYDINFMTGVYLNTSKFLELAASEIPTLRGAKISSRELPAVTDCTVAAGGRFQVLIGTDEQLLSALSMGVDVPVCNSFLGGLFSRLKAAFDANDMDTARKEHLLARKLVLERSSYGGGPALVKGIMRCLGFDLGSVRLPLVNLTADQEKQLRQDLINIGFMDQ
ncbi:N-acetylneuraminate lyase-like [Babylonia areolata]|uniref:N-acetylneuraminate lyase-like n=1 Tax=Babylonia areolata TaxID=304850 RepID=UPI003FD08C5B